MDGGGPCGARPVTRAALTPVSPASPGQSKRYSRLAGPGVAGTAPKPSYRSRRTGPDAAPVVPRPGARVGDWRGTGGTAAADSRGRARRKMPVRWPRTRSRLHSHGRSVSCPRSSCALSPSGSCRPWTDGAGGEMATRNGRRRRLHATPAVTTRRVPTSRFPGPQYSRAREKCKVLHDSLCTSTLTLAARGPYVLDTLAGNSRRALTIRRLRCLPR